MTGTKYSEGRLQEFIGTHPHLIDPVLYRAETIAEAEWPGRYRPDFYFPDAKLVLELKTAALTKEHLQQLEGYLARPPTELSGLRGVLVGARSDHVDELRDCVHASGLPIEIRLWEEDVPLPDLCALCEECGAASLAHAYRFCPYCHRRGRLRRNQAG